jgi:hypothetical protein
LNFVPIQVVFGLIVPVYIKRLEFKTREELQQMPQTEEEHLENQYLDFEDKEKSITDAEVRKSLTIGTQSRNSFSSIGAESARKTF